MQLVKTNHRRATAITVCCLAGVLAAAALTALYFFVWRPDRLLRRLDVNDDLAVMEIMKYRSKDPAAVKKIAAAYLDASRCTDAALFSLYGLQYLAPDDPELLSLTRESYARQGADAFFLSQFDAPQFDLAAFQPTAAFEGMRYGASNGIYLSFCGGKAQAKISSVIPSSLYAVEGGVNVLDSADQRVKFISADGLKVLPLTTFEASEYLHFQNRSYYIDTAGVPRTDAGEIPLGAGERAIHLRVEEDGVCCTVLDPDDRPLRDISLR